jgi:hypothetical protein
MPEEEKLKQEPMVDIDTSGPDVEVNLEEEKKLKNQRKQLKSKRNKKQNQKKK